MSYVFSLKGCRHKRVPRDVEYLLDQLIMQPFVEIPDSSLSKKLGRYTSELKNKGLLRIYWNKDDNASIARLKINNFVRPNSVFKNKGKLTEYVFKDTLIPKKELPSLF